eukprot:scaffold3235_cov84-Isochrysis_galbana.AAC.2
MGAATYRLKCTESILVHAGFCFGVWREGGAVPSLECVESSIVGGYFPLGAHFGFGTWGDRGCTAPS